MRFSCITDAFDPLSFFSCIYVTSFVYSLDVALSLLVFFHCSMKQESKNEWLLLFYGVFCFRMRWETINTILITILITIKLRRFFCKEWYIIYYIIITIVVIIYIKSVQFNPTSKNRVLGCHIKSKTKIDNMNQNIKVFNIICPELHYHKTLLYQQKHILTHACTWQPLKNMITIIKMHYYIVPPRHTYTHTFGPCFLPQHIILY